MRCVLTQYYVFTIVKKLITRSKLVIVNRPGTGGYILYIVRWIVLKIHVVAMIVKRPMVTKIDLHGYIFWTRTEKNYSLSYCNMI